MQKLLESALIFKEGTNAIFMMLAMMLQDIKREQVGFASLRSDHVEHFHFIVKLPSFCHAKIHSKVTFGLTRLNIVGKFETTY